MNALLAILRIAWRDARRHAARTATVVTLVALPVMLIVAGGALNDAVAEPHDALATRLMGRAALLARGGTAQELGARVDEALAGLAASTVQLAGGEESLSCGATTLTAKFVVLDAAEDLAGLAGGMVELIDGALPAGPGGVALSVWLADTLDRQLGDTVTLRDGETRVVGIVRDPGLLALPLIVRVVGAGADAAESYGLPWILVDVAERDIEAAASGLRSAGLAVTDRRDVTMIDDGFETTVVFGVGTFATFLATLILGATFAVHMPRRRAALALLEAQGAAPSALVTAEILTALALALLGTLLGTALGLALSHAVHPSLAEWTGRLPSAIVVPWPLIAGALLLACVALAVVVAIPTWRVVRSGALRGRLTTAAPRSAPARLAGACLGGGAAGVAWASTSTHGAAPPVAILGATLWMGGMLLAVPAVLDVLGRRAADWPLAWRLVARDSARMRDRHAPVIAAVTASMTIIALLVVLARTLEVSMHLATDGAPLAADQIVLEGPSAAALAGQLRKRDDHLASSALLAAAADGHVLRALVSDTSAPNAPLGPAPWIAIGGSETLIALGAEASDTTALGAALVAFRAPRQVASDHIAIRLDTPSAPTFTARVIPAAPILHGPALLARPDFAAAQGWLPTPPPDTSLTPWLVRFSTPVSRQLADELGARATRTSTTVTSHLDSAPAHLQFDGLLFGVGLATALCVIVLATALSSSEARRDAATLHSIGADPTTLTALRTARAAYLALLGGLLAIPAATVPFLALLTLVDIPVDITIPWSRIALAVLGLPLLSALGSRALAAWSPTPLVARSSHH